MWKCKKCGGTDFEEERIVRNKISPYEINKNGLVSDDEYKNFFNNWR